LIFSLDILGSEHDIVIGQKMTGTWLQGTETHSDNVADDARPGALWWDGDQWLEAELANGKNVWTGSDVQRHTNFYDRPGWLVSFDLYRSYHYYFRTYVALRSQPTYRLGYTDWDVWITHNNSVVTTRDFSHTPFVED
jgi:hypothetical protein